jgi:hypothetical protein
MNGMTRKLTIPGVIAEVYYVPRSSLTKMTRFLALAE